MLKGLASPLAITPGKVVVDEERIGDLLLQKLRLLCATIRGPQALDI